MLVFPSAQADTMAEYTLCAVYHRMIASQLSREQQLDDLADIEKEKMQDMITLAKAAANQEQGIEFGAEAFLDEWRYHIGQMEKRIDKNYANMYRLKYRYREHCQKVAARVAANKETVKESTK